MIAEGQHKNLKNVPFYFEGDRICEQSVQRRVQVVQDQLNKQWPAPATDGLGVISQLMRNKDEVYREVMDNKLKLIEQVKLEQQLREQRLPLSLDEHHHLQGEHINTGGQNVEDRGPEEGDERDPENARESAGKE